MEGSKTEWQRVKIYQHKIGDGKIVTLGIWFPSGTGNSVRVRFDISGQKIPEPSQHSDDYYVGDNVRYPLLVNIPIDKNTEVFVEYINNSTVGKQFGITWEFEEWVFKKKEKKKEQDVKAEVSKKTEEVSKEELQGLL